MVLGTRLCSQARWQTAKLSSSHCHKWISKVKLTFNAVAAFFHSGVSLWQWPHLLEKTQPISIIQILQLFHKVWSGLVGFAITEQSLTANCRRLMIYSWRREEAMPHHHSDFCGKTYYISAQERTHICTNPQSYLAFLRHKCEHQNPSLLVAS